ncbi:hypothetical protein BJ508DRAFT_328377, partial [Ascobolus immersus RN42]
HIWDQHLVQAEAAAVELPESVPSSPEAASPKAASPEAASPKAAEAGSPKIASPEAGSPEAASPEAGSPEEPAEAVKLVQLDGVLSESTASNSGSEDISELSSQGSTEDSELRQAELEERRKDTAARLKKPMAAGKDRQAPTTGSTGKSKAGRWQAPTASSSGKIKAAKSVPAAVVQPKAQARQRVAVRKPTQLARSERGPPRVPRLRVAEVTAVPASIPQSAESVPVIPHTSVSVPEIVIDTSYLSPSADEPSKTGAVDLHASASAHWSEEQMEAASEEELMPVAVQQALALKREIDDILRQLGIANDESSSRHKTILTSTEPLPQFSTWRLGLKTQQFSETLSTRSERTGLGTRLGLKLQFFHISVFIEAKFSLWPIHSAGLDRYSFYKDTSNGRGRQQQQPRLKMVKLLHLLSLALVCGTTNGAPVQSLRSTLGSLIDFLSANNTNWQAVGGAGIDTSILPPFTFPSLALPYKDDERNLLHIMAAAPVYT